VWRLTRWYDNKASDRLPGKTRLLPPNAAFPIRADGHAAWHHSTPLR
jgi:hypothetical protein